MHAADPLFISASSLCSVVGGSGVGTICNINKLSACWVSGGVSSLFLFFFLLYIIRKFVLFDEYIPS